MKALKFGILLAASGFVAMNANAQVEQQDIEALKVEIDKINDKLKMYNQQLAQSQAMVDSYNKTSMQNEAAVKDKKELSDRVKFYGFIRADAGYQLDGEKGMAHFVNSLRLEGDPPKPTSASNRFETTIASSRVGMDIEIPLFEKNIKGKIEVDFGAGAYKEALRLRHAYVKNDNWLIGQTTSNFVSFATSPEMVDFITPLGGGTFRPMMLRYENKINENTPYVVAFEKGHDQNQLPAFTTKISHQFSDNVLVNFRALVQEVRVPELNDQTKIGTGVALGMNYKPIEKLIFNANFSNVSGDNKFLLGTSDNKRYLLNKSKLELVEYNALTAGMTYKFTSQLRSTIGYGNLTYRKNNNDGNKELEQAWINLGYTPWKPVTMAMEYANEKRETMEGRKGNHDRVGLIVKYDF